jgi:NTP pyrophosphatase (non-canonical NTP hydrolase)
MDFDELIKFVKTEDERLMKLYGYPEKDKAVLSRTVKVAEEFGELCNEVLSSRSLQRKEKLAEHNNDKLAEEYADVFLSTLLLGKALDIDIEQAVRKKIEKIKARQY